MATILVLWVGYTGFWAQKYESDARIAFEENGRRAADLFSRAVAGALWEFDFRSVERTLAGLKVWPGFVFAAVHEPGGEFASYQAKTRRTPDSTLLPADFDGQTTVRHGEFVYFLAPVEKSTRGEIGQFVAVFDQQPLNHVIWTARRDAVISAVAGFTLLGFLLVRVARSVTNPLVRITEAVERVAEGDLDYTVPDCHTLDEVGRLARALEVFRKNAGRLVAVKAEAAANKRAADLAMIDELTGLANRRAVLERFASIEGSRDHAEPDQVSILHIDLDGFKQINDTLGHKAGDHVIQQVARRLLRMSQRCSLVARIGGDEFVLLVHHGSEEGKPQEIANAVIRDMSQPIIYGGQALRIGASIGIARHKYGEERMSDTLVHADIALYRAKAKGKSRFVTFDETHRQELLDRKRMSDELLEAIDKNRFVPFFQAIVEAGSHRLVAVEMLVRWDHPEKGILPPADFLDIANDLNFMRLIDKQIFCDAIQIFKSWSDEGITLPRLCINATIDRLVETGFVDMLAGAREAGIAVDVELLESIYLDDPSDRLLWQLDQVRELGVGINIDDFGTGHASVAGLIQIEPDKVKIDRRFVMPILESTRARNLVETLLGICSLLEIEAVAEGVESAEHAKILHDLGCNYLQGFAFMKPVSAADLRLVLENSNLGATG